MRGRVDDPILREYLSEMLRVNKDYRRLMDTRSCKRMVKDMSNHEDKQCQPASSPQVRTPVDTTTIWTDWF